MALEESFEKAAEGQATDESPQDHQNVDVHQAGPCFFRAELNGLAPGSPVGFPGVRCPDLHSMFRFGSRFRKVVSIPGITKYYNLWRKQKVRAVPCVEEKSGCVGVCVCLPNRSEKFKPTPSQPGHECCNLRPEYSREMLR